MQLPQNVLCKLTRVYVRVNVCVRARLHALGPYPTACAWQGVLAESTRLICALALHEGGQNVYKSGVHIRGGGDTHMHTHTTHTNLEMFALSSSHIHIHLIGGQTLQFPWEDTNKHYIFLWERTVNTHSYSAREQINIKPESQQRCKDPFLSFSHTQTAFHNYSPCFSSSGILIKSINSYFYYLISFAAFLTVGFIMALSIALLTALLPP